MHNIQKVVLMRHGYRDDNARSETWNSYDDSILVAAETDELVAKLEKWNQQVVDRRVKELRIANGETAKSLASCTAREAAVSKLTAEQKSVLGIKTENFNAQRLRHQQELDRNAELIERLESLSLQEIMRAGLVPVWWAFEAADIKSLTELEAELSDADDSDD